MGCGGSKNSLPPAPEHQQPVALPPNEKENPLNSHSGDDMPRNDSAESPYPNAKDVPEGTMDVEAITARFTPEQRKQVKTSLCLINWCRNRSDYTHATVAVVVLRR